MPILRATLRPSSNLDPKVIQAIAAGNARRLLAI
jgi:hypothetical protein